MTNILPNELVQARRLMDQAKFDEALEIVENFEKTESLTQEAQLSAIIIKGRVYLYQQRTRKALQAYEIAYQMSQDLGFVSETVSALIGKAYIGLIGDTDKASKYIQDAERGLNSILDDSSREMLRRDLLLIKTWILLVKANMVSAVESARECLRLTEEKKVGNKLDLALTYLLLGYSNNILGNRSKALDYAMKSLECNKELNHTIAIADSYSLIAKIYRQEGEYEKALQFGKLSLSIEGISGRTKLDALWTVASIYYFKSELNRALKYGLQALALAEELNITDQLVSILVNLGYLYRVKGNDDLAIDYFERCLTLSEKWGLIYPMAQSLELLTVMYIDKKSQEKANRYFSRLSELHNQSKIDGGANVSTFYLFAKVYIKKHSTRMRDRVEAQEIFKNLIETSSGDNLIYALGGLCDLLLEELSMYNDLDILDEIIPLITRSLEIAETAHNYSWLAETKLLQAKLALIQMDVDEARKLMVEAQRIADYHGLNLLA
ncbi:MAG: tetratricopeptide repeat protein, partial [Candidatus Hermodarchaeota archaeon]